MYIFIDTETAGLPDNYDLPASNYENWPRLVQIAWLLFDDKFKLLKEKNYIIIPENYSIPNHATQIHGISTDLAKKAGNKLSTVLNEFDESLFQAEYIIAHNVDFDENVILAEKHRNRLNTKVFANKKKICTMKSTTNFCKINGNFGYKWPTLTELYFKLFDRNYENVHNALFDVQATKDCFFELNRIGIFEILNTSFHGKPEAVKMNLKGPVSHIKEFSYKKEYFDFFADKDFLFNEISHLDKKFQNIEITTYWFDKNGYLIKKDEYKPSSNEYISENHNYNNEGYSISEEVIDLKDNSSFNTFFYFETELDTWGNEVNLLIYENDKLIEEIRNAYNTEGKITERNFYNHSRPGPKGHVMRETYEYKQNNRLIINTLNPDVIDGSVGIGYDEDDDISLKYYIDCNQQLMKNYYNYEYMIDSHRNWVKQSTFQRNLGNDDYKELTEIRERVIVYFDDETESGDSTNSENNSTVDYDTEADLPF